MADRAPAWIVLTLAAALFGAACSAHARSTSEQRAVIVPTEACGHASKTTGSGIIGGPGEVLTAAHGVIGASRVSVATGSGPMVSAGIAWLDPTRDLAVLSVSGVLADEVELAFAEGGQSRIVSILGWWRYTPG